MDGDEASLKAKRFILGSLRARIADLSQQIEQYQKMIEKLRHQACALTASIEVESLPEDHRKILINSHLQNRGKRAADK